MPDQTSPPAKGWTISSLLSKESLGVVSIVLGIVLSAINIYLFFNGATKREVDRLKAQIETLDLQPTFEVTYYAVPVSNPLAFFIIQNAEQRDDVKDIHHPLIESALLVDRRGKAFFIPADAADTDAVTESLRKHNGIEYDTLDCSYYVINFKYSGAMKLPRVTFKFDLLNGAGDILPSVDSIQFSDESYAAAVSSLKKQPTDIEVANVAKDDSFFVPFTLGCYGNKNEGGEWIDFSYKTIGLPISIEFENPITARTESTQVRTMLKNILINSTGIAERG